MQPLRRCDIVMLRTNGGDHPCVMLTDPMKIKGEGRAVIIWVCLTTSRVDKYDPTCVFETGEGKLIMAGSYVLYERAEARKVHELEAMIAKRNRRVRRISRAAYKRIVEGLLISPKAPPGVKEYLMEARRRGLAD